jgi:PAS domain S-box-containing protein
MLTAILCGFFPGVVATVVATLLSVYWTMPPRGEWHVETAADALALALFATIGVSMSAISGLYRRATERAALLERELILRESEERFRRREEESLHRYELISANSRDIVLFMRRDDGRILEANAAASAAYGFTHEELMALTIHALRAPDTQRWTADQMSAADERGVLFETVHRRKDGSTFPVEVSSQGSTIQGGRTLISVVRDITERKQREEEARARTAELEAILDCLADGVMVYDDQGRIVRSTPNADEILRIPKAERGMSLVERVARRYVVLSEDGRPVGPEEMVAFRAAVRGETVKNVIQRVRSGDEEPRWLNLSATPLLVSGKRTGAVISLTDITQRKQAELELVKVKERLENTLGSITEGYYALDERWQFVAANTVAEVHFGEAAGALLAQNIWTMTGTPPEAPLRRRFEEARATGRPVHFDAESHVRPGYWAEIHLYPRGDLLDVYFADASERKRAEAALRQAVGQLGAERDRLAVTLRSIGDAVIATDELGRVELFNVVAEQLTGWRAEEAKGTPIEDIFTIIDEESRQPAVSPVGRVLREGVTLGLANHTALVAKNGTERPIADSAAPICDEAGRVTGVVLVFRDQTEERKAERELRESEARLRQLAEALPQLVWTANEDGKVDSFSERWRAYTGQARGEEDWSSALHLDDREHVLARWQIAVSEQREFEVEHRLRRADGEYRWYLRRAILLVAGGATRGRWFGTCTDIHDLKLSQDALRQADRLKEDFLSMASHEFRTPLSALRLQAEIMRRRLRASPAPDDRNEKVLAVMDAQVTRMDKLLATLVDVSRINAGRFTLDLASVDLAELARDSSGAPTPGTTKASGLGSGS